MSAQSRNVAADAALAGAEGRWPFSPPNRASARNDRRNCPEGRSISLRPGSPRSLFSPSIPTAHAAPGSSRRCFAGLGTAFAGLGAVSAGRATASVTEVTTLPSREGGYWYLSVLGKSASLSGRTSSV